MAEHEAEPADAQPVLVVLVGAVVALTLLIGVLAVVRDEGDDTVPRDRRAEATATATAWLRAWAEGDRPALRRLLAGRAPGLIATLNAFDAGVRPGPITATPGDPIVAGDVATVPFEASVELPGFSAWRYEGSLSLVDIDVRAEDDDDETVREWRVAFSPSAIHPALRAGRRLERTRAWSQRGVLLDTNGVPLPATGPLRTIVGFLGAANAEQAAALGPPYETGDVIGQSGLQAGSERALAGTPSAEVRLLEGDQMLGVVASFAGTPGRSVRTTIDPRLVDAGAAALGPDGGAAALVAIQPSTGAIRAVVNRPANGFNRALQGRYPPGSTFKVVTTLALLGRGITPDTPVSCPKTVRVGGRRFSNAEDEELGDIVFRDAFTHSCNTAFIQLAGELTPEELQGAARMVGFDAEPAPGAFTAMSQFPAPNGPIDKAASAIGQGRVLATPLQMASIAATVAAGGYRPPHLVELPAPLQVEPLAPGAADVVRELMRLAVAEGTGTRARLPGTPVAGKTGTAEFGVASPPRTHAWFIAFRGDLAVAVVVEGGGFGGEVAAPIAADFFRRAGG